MDLRPGDRFALQVENPPLDGHVVLHEAQGELPGRPCFQRGPIRAMALGRRHDLKEGKHVHLGRGLGGHEFGAGGREFKPAVGGRGRPDGRAFLLAAGRQNQVQLRPGKGFSLRAQHAASIHKGLARLCRRIAC